MQRKVLILLTNESEECLVGIKKLVNENIKNVELVTFKDKRHLMMYDHIADADLIITDISISDDKEEMRTYNDQLVKIAAPGKIPLLLVVSDDKFDDNLIDYFSKCSIYDFVRKPFNYKIFVNRIKVLLNIPRTKKTLEDAKRKVEINLWNLLNYSNLLILVLTKDNEIKLCNYRLCKFLGFDNEEEVVGKQWPDFLNESDRSVLAYIQDKMKEKIEDFEEVAYDIITPDGGISVKWFISMINSDLNWTFCIGMPIYSGITIEDNLDTLRSYFRDIIVKDRTTINAMREVTKKMSDKRIEKNKEIEIEDAHPFDDNVSKFDLQT
jgi:PAS domain S-box-containing protein